MCFSAGASFTAGAFLSIIGLLSLYKAPKKYKLFGMIPLLFALQQISEGFLWTLKDAPSTDPMRQALVYIFLFFALVVWPTWMPLSTHIFETKKNLKRACGVLLCLGFVISSILLATMIIHGATANITGCHIAYNLTPFSSPPRPWGILVYAIATLGPLFIVSLPGSSFIGALLALAGLVTWFVWHAFFTSVWCFFAAIISVFILIYTPYKKAS